MVLHGRQRLLYESLRLSLADELRQVVAERGIAHFGIVVLDALLKLRQVGCDPRLVKLEAALGVRESTKFQPLMDMLPVVLAEGRKVLLFYQFTQMLKLIAQELDRRRIRYVTLTVTPAIAPRRCSVSRTVTCRCSCFRSRPAGSA